MKIRTSFVTNSSSYSSAEIKIDNQVLLEILKRYKEKGAFIRGNNEEFDFGIGESERTMYWKLFGSDDLSSDDFAFDENGSELDTDPMAFYFQQDESAEIFYAPKTIEEVADNIMEVINYDVGHWVHWKNPTLLKELEKELKDRAKEINENFVKVSWEAGNWSHGEAEPEEDEETMWEYHYKNGKESYKVGYGPNE